MNRSDPVLKCSDLVSLRAPRLSDAESLAKHANDWNVWINLRDRMPHPYTLADATDWLERIQHEEPRMNFIIDLDGEPIGCIGLVLGKDIERCSAEVGYWMERRIGGAGSRRWHSPASARTRSRIWDS